MFKSKTLLLVVAVGLISASMATAGSITFSSPSYSVAPGGQVTIEVDISGGDALQALTLYLQIGDGGSDAGGTDSSPPAPKFIDVIVIDPTAANAHVFKQGDSEDPDAYASGGLIASSGASSATNRTGTGILAKAVIDATGAAANTTWALRLDVPGFGLQTQTAGSSGLFPNTLGTSEIHITPEPVTALLLLGALPLLRRRRIG